MRSLSRIELRTWRRVLLCLIVLLLVGTTIPGGVKSSIEGRMWHVIPWSMCAHFTLFAAIAVVPVYGTGRHGVLRAVALAVLLAFITENLQRFVPGRHPLLRDALIDLIGTTLGLATRTIFGLSPVSHRIQ